MQKRIEINGMSCGNCVRHVQEELAKLPGIQVQQADLGSVTIDYDPAAVPLEKVHSTIVEAGYQVRE